MSGWHVQHRFTSRAILISDQGRVLLFLTHFDPGANLPPRWILPGGGIELGETRLACLIRELHEETGLQIAANQILDLDLQIAFRQDWQNEKFETGIANIYLARVVEFDPNPVNWTPEEHRDNVSHRWWSLDEIMSENPWIGPDGLHEHLLRELRVDSSACS